MREYEYELDDELNSVLNKYIRDEEDYKDLCVQIFEASVEDNPEAQQLISTFESIGANNLEAKIKLAELMIAGL
ncbi:hypothetical protein [Staphylococcus saprophyticus]|uniref:hypothetical protein n=1 Tax=Staphylococcus saprophyticus TaxID=29385 RepID=UPI000E68AFB3|nr:hypothetical protein [Staphylococcus saprophyticus]RIO25474.1 hypothetical protein BUZ82_05630 [Staphylococcus saprophyticus]